MTTQAIKKRHYKRILVITLFVFLIAFIGEAISYLLIRHSATTIASMNKMRENIEENTKSQRQIESIIKENTRIKEEYQQVAQNNILDIAAKKIELETIFQALKANYGFISNIVTSIEPHEVYMNAGFVTIIVYGQGVTDPQLQEKINIGVSKLVFKFINSLQKNFHVYPNSLEYNEQSNTIKYLYKK